MREKGREEKKEEGRKERRKDGEKVTYVDSLKGFSHFKVSVS